MNRLSTNIKSVYPKGAAGLLLAAGLLALPGCSDERLLSGVLPEGREIALQATRAAESGSTDQYKPAFVFWMKATATDPTSTDAPFLVDKSVPLDVNSYSTSPYNTQKAYPGDFTLLVATGYIPQSLEPEQVSGATGTTTANYKKLLLPSADKPGRLELMAPSNFLRGSLMAPFHTADEKTLKFQHLQSKLVFLAKLHTDYPEQYYVDQVKVEIAGTDLVGSLVWNHTDQRYDPKAATSGSVELGHGYTDLDGKLIEVDVWPQGESTDLGGIYIYPGKAVLTLAKVSARIYPTTTGEADREKFTKVQADVQVSFTSPSGGYETLQAGESQEVTIIFKFDGVEISARKMPWQQGGNIIIPVIPEDKVTN